jgi:2-keto-4-pentenoate hydratase
MEGRVVHSHGHTQRGAVAGARRARKSGDVCTRKLQSDPRYADFEATSPTLRLADQGLHGALVVGSGIPWRGTLAWDALVAIVRRDGEIQRETRGGHPLGNLLFMLPWLARHAAQRGLPLCAGDIVTAGTWTGVYEAGPRQTIDVEFTDIGRASARFE